MITSKANSTTFQHNSDLTGNVTIINVSGSLDVSGDDLLEFILNYLRSEKIRKLEEMQDEQLFNNIIEGL